MQVLLVSHLQVPTTNPLSPPNMYNWNKVYVKKVFSAVHFTDVMLDNLNFVQGVIDLDDVSGETLLQHSLLNIGTESFIRPPSLKIIFGIINHSATRRPLFKPQNQALNGLPSF